MVEPTLDQAMGAYNGGAIGFGEDTGRFYNTSSGYDSETHPNSVLWNAGYLNMNGLSPDTPGMGNYKSWGTVGDIYDGRLDPGGRFLAPGEGANKTTGWLRERGPNYDYSHENLNGGEGFMDKFGWLIPLMIASGGLLAGAGGIGAAGAAGAEGALSSLGAGSSFAVPGGMSSVAGTIGGPISTTMALQSGVPAWLSGAGAGAGAGALAGGGVDGWGGVDWASGANLGPSELQPFMPDPAAVEGGFQTFRPGGAEDLGMTQEAFMERALGTSEIPMTSNGSTFMSRLMSGLGSSMTSPQSLLRSLISQGVTSGTPGGGRSFLDQAMSVGSGIYGLTQSSRMRKLAEENSRRADPFGPFRGEYAGMLQGLMRDPSGITKYPGYQAGNEAVQRSMAAQGYQGSGNMMAALQKYGGDFFDKAVAQLSGLAGAGFNPANAASISQSGNQSAIDLASRSLASIGYGAAGRTPTSALLERFLGAV